jgi:hypothetical protein
MGGIMETMRQRMLQLQEQDVEEQGIEEKDVVQERQEEENQEETYATRHRGRTRRSMQTYPSSPELGEGCGSSSSRKFRSL